MFCGSGLLPDVIPIFLRYVYTHRIDPTVSHTQFVSLLRLAYQVKKFAFKCAPLESDRRVVESPPRPLHTNRDCKLIHHRQETARSTLDTGAVEADWWVTAMSNIILLCSSFNSLERRPPSPLPPLPRWKFAGATNRFLAREDHR